MAVYNRVARQEFPSTDAGRRGKTDVTYVYMDESFQTVNFTLTLEEDTPAKVEETLKERARHAAEAGPRQIEI